MMKATSIIAVYLFFVHSWIHHVGSSSIDKASMDYKSNDVLDPRSDVESHRRAALWANFTPTQSPNLPSYLFVPRGALCDNGLCDNNEDASSCPEDCSYIQLSTADTGGAKGSIGYMFSIKPLRDVTITSLDIYTRSEKGDQLVEVYTRLGTYSGYELSQDGWELVYLKRLYLNGRKPTSLEELNIHVPADTTLSFYIYVPNKIRYTKDRTVGDGSVYMSDDVLEVYEGVGVRNEKFGKGNYTEDVVFPRAFTGSIRYDVGFTSQPGTEPQPGTDNPTQSPIVSDNMWHTNWNSLACQQGYAPSWNNPRYDTLEGCCRKSLSFLPEVLESCLSAGATLVASASPTASPSKSPTHQPSNPLPSSASPSDPPSTKPTFESSKKPTYLPTMPSPAPPNQSTSSTRNPTKSPTRLSTKQPTLTPSKSPTATIVKKISFVAFGDIPYTKDQRYCLNKQLRELNQEQMDFKFMVHVGDLKWGKEPCYENSFSDIAEIFTHPSNKLSYDASDCFFVPGDNEFQDCPNESTDQAWSWWMQYFGNGDRIKTDGLPNENGFGTLAKQNITVHYQNQGLVNGLYPSTAGNFAFFTEDVLFIGINQVGGGRVGDESTRVHGNYMWVEENMAKYKLHGIRALVLFAHASLASTRWRYFGDPFMSLLREQYPDIVALYIHGDGHNFETYQPDYDNPNLFSLEVDGGEEADPLLISIMYNTVEDEIGFNIDIRGGYYYSGCQAGNIDKTWSSNY